MTEQIKNEENKTVKPKKGNRQKIIKKREVDREFRLFDFRVSIHKPSEEDFKTLDKTRDHTKMSITMFGVNIKGETCSIEVNNFKPFFYIEVDKVFDEKKLTNLENEIGNALIDSSEKKSSYFNKSFNCSCVKKHKLYGFASGKLSNFVLITFNSQASFNKVKNLWTYNNKNKPRYNTSKDKKIEILNKVYDFTKYKLYESNIPPLLRFFHIHDICPTGWVRVNSKPNESLDTNCKYKFECDSNKLIPLNDKEDNVPFKICSFDIEASSSHGDFPVPIKSYKKLAMNIVDGFKSKQIEFKDKTDSTKYNYLKKILYAAFSFGKCENVDIVYLKDSRLKNKENKPKPEVKTKYIDVALEKIKCKASFKEKDSDKKSKNNDGSKPATINDILNSVTDSKREYIEQAINSTNTILDDDNDENTTDSDFNQQSFNAEGILDKKTTNKSVTDKKSVRDSSVLEILDFDKKYTRDDRITIMDHVLCSLLPELEGDKVTFIGSTFMKHGDTEPYYNNCLVVGGCDDVPGADIQCVKDEKDILLEWAKLIQNEDPDIIIGYNIFGFDYEFMFRRSRENEVSRKFLELSRIKSDLGHGVCGKLDKIGQHVESIENKQLVIASGEYDLKYYDIPGRLQIDMYAYFRRDFNLSSYKLDDVAGENISDTIKHVECCEDSSGNPMTELYSGNITGLHKNDYIHLELVTFTVDYYAGGKKFKVMDIYEKEKDGKKINVIVIEGHHHFEAKKKLKWGIAKDDVTPQDIFRLTNGNDSDRAIVAKYCIQDCNLVHHLMRKIDVITGYIEMSNICNVPISFLVFRGQGIKLTSYVAKKCREKNTLMPDLEKGPSDGGYEGAIVLPPKCSMYMDNPVACVDYSSLYPSSMISQNYSHDSKVWTKEYDLDGNPTCETGEKDDNGQYKYDNLPGYQYINTEFDLYEYRRKNEKSKAEKTKVGRKICRWAQLPNNGRSIMPAILEELLKARKDTRKKIKTEPDPFMKNILDKRQLGYKVTANSLYGQCGARTSTFYEKDVAASTTATGRQMIIYARGMIETMYGNRIVTLKNGENVRTRAEYIYGDTDSVFYTFNLEDLEGNKIVGQRALEMTIELSFEVEKLSSAFLKPPMYLEYEKTFMPFVLLSKKRYVGTLYEDDPNKGYLKYMGLSLKRRDSCDYLKDTYGEIINILMQTKDVKIAIEFLNNSLQRLIEGNVHMDKLAITKALRSDYKNPQQIGHWVLSDRIGKRDPGNKPKPGDRIKYVFITNPNKKALTGEKIETPEFITQNNLTIDYAYYITNQLMKPLQQLFGLAIEDIWNMQKKYNAIKRHRQEIIKLQDIHQDDIENFMKAREKECSKKIKILLFDKKLKDIENKINKQTELKFTLKDQMYTTNIFDSSQNMIYKTNMFKNISNTNTNKTKSREKKKVNDFFTMSQIA